MTTRIPAPAPPRPRLVTQVLKAVEDFGPDWFSKRHQASAFPTHASRISPFTSPRSASSSASSMSGVVVIHRQSWKASSPASSLVSGRSMCVVAPCLGVVWVPTRCCLSVLGGGTRSWVGVLSRYRSSQRVNASSEGCVCSHSLTPTCPECSHLVSVLSGCSHIAVWVSGQRSGSGRQRSEASSPEPTRRHPSPRVVTRGLSVVTVWLDVVIEYTNGLLSHRLVSPVHFASPMLLFDMWYCVPDRVVEFEALRPQVIERRNRYCLRALPPRPHTLHTVETLERETKNEAVSFSVFSFLQCLLCSEYFFFFFREGREGEWNGVGLRGQDPKTGWERERAGQLAKSCP